MTNLDPICLYGMDNDLIFNIASHHTIRQGRREEFEVTRMGQPGAAQLPLTSRLNRKRTLHRLLYFDANHEQTLRDRSAKIGG